MTIILQLKEEKKTPLCLEEAGKQGNIQQRYTSQWPGRWALIKGKVRQSRCWVWGTLVMPKFCSGGNTLLLINKPRLPEEGGGPGKSEGGK